MSIYLYKDNATELYVFKYKGFVFNPKPGSMMLIERVSDGFVNLQAVYDNKAFRQNTNGHILNDFVDPELILDGTGTAYGAAASDILTALSDFFVDAPASTGATDLLGGIAHNAAAPTPGVSGKYYFTSAGVCTWLPGSPTVAVGDTVLVVFNDPTYTYVYVPVAYELLVNKKQTVTNSSTDYPSGAGVTASLALKTDISELNKIFPLYNYNVRVGLDSGLIKDLSHLTDLYRQNLSLLDSTVFLWNGEAGTKRRTSGSNTFASKLYNMANKVQQFGAELVTGGTFTGADGSTPAGWTGSNAILTIDVNRLKITNTSTGYGAAMQSIQTIIGKTYHFTFSQQNGDSQAIIYLGTTNGSSNVYTSGVLNNASSITRTISFIAQSTTTYIYTFVYNTGIGNYTFFDNISVKQMDWIEGTNDAAQSTEANQPYLGGLIAPNEVGKLKTFNQTSTIISNSSIVFGSNDSWSLTTSVLLNSVGTASDNERLLFGSFFSQIRFQAVLYFFASNNATPVTLLSESFIKSKIGKNIVFTVVGRAGVLSVYVDGLLINTITADTASDFRNIYAENNQLLYLQIHNRALSASEIQAQHEFLRLQIPEIEGVAIGNQYWATSNHEGVVAGDGSVIPEVQNSDNVEKITNAADREFSGDTGFWTKTGAATINNSGNGLLNLNATLGGDASISRSAFLNADKWYKFTYTVVANRGGGLRIEFYAGGSPLGVINSAVGTHILYYRHTSSQFILRRQGDCDIDIDNISIEEVGWSQSTVLYNAIYAQTSGTAAVKELAALKAAAMWCYYDNNVNNGAIYGKLYNWYTVKLISLYPPTGYRVPLGADFEQLANYLGGSTVAGGKLKALYGGFNNSFASNESGFSGIGAGLRASSGVFSDIGVNTRFRTNVDSAYGLFNSSTLLTTTSGTIEQGRSLRLLRNSPAGPNETTVTTGTIVNALGAGNLDIVIPFGYAVDSIKVISKTGITGLSAKYCSRNPSTLAVTELDTLFTAKTVVADTPKLFNCNVDQTIQRQDAVVRINGTKADTAAEFEVRVNIKKAIL